MLNMSKTHTDKNEGIFLATTALEEFWDSTKPIVFLGEWCLLHNRRSFWESIGDKIIDYPFSNSEKLHEAFRYTNEIYERTLILVGEALNTMHGTKYSDHYWRIVIGPWLYRYVTVVYDRYACLKQALSSHPDFETIGLSENSFVVASNMNEFVELLLSDSFNLQIYTRILAALRKKFPCKDLQATKKNPPSPIHRNTWGFKLKNHTAKALEIILMILVHQPIVLKNSYFCRSKEIQLMFRTKGMILPFWSKISDYTVTQNIVVARKNLPHISLGTSEFEKCLSSMLLLDIPMCYVENYKTISTDAEKLYPKKVKAIFSATAWYFDEHFKCWAATSAERGVLLIGTQHGGNYGALTIVEVENHETAIVDYYYSWGWKRTDCFAKVIPMPASKLLGRKKIGADSKKSGVLWVTCIVPRYLFRFPYLPKHFSKYLSWQHRFAKTLAHTILASLRVRPHQNDYGWDIIQRLNECMPRVAIETWNVPFQESLANCRLYVCDHLSTSYIEALAANKPTILFWNPQTNELRPEAQPYYDLLRKNGILFDTPESAGIAVNQIYDDIEAWWNDPERQNAVEIFCEQFARNSPDAIELWDAEFRRIAAIMLHSKKSIPRGAQN